MEGLQVPSTASVTTPKNHPLATWSLILGIAGCVLCFLFIPALLAIIFGIIALVKISNSAGMLTGKGKAITGIILGGVSFILIPFVAIIAAIAIPSFIGSRTVANEHSAIAQLKSLVSCEAVWRMQDSDRNSKDDYWTYDVSCLYRMKDSSGQAINIIELSLARADGAPADNNTFGDAVIPSLGEKIAKAGYLLRAMTQDETGQHYNQDEVNGVKATNPYKFAFVAYPAQYGSTGVRTFIVNEAGTVYAIDTGSDANKIILQWPGQDPTSVEGPKPGTMWQPAD